MDRSDCFLSSYQPNREKLNTLPFSLSMVQGTVTRNEYQFFLGQMFYVHRIVELELQRFPELEVIYDCNKDRTEHLLMDLCALGAKKIDTPNGQVHEIVRFVQVLSEEDPWNLLSVLYVSEALRPDSLDAVKPLSAALNVDLRPNSGLDYHLTGIATRTKSRQKFQKTIDLLPLSQSQTERNSQAIAELMQLLCELYVTFGVEFQGTPLFPVPNSDAPVTGVSVRS